MKTKLLAIFAVVILAGCASVSVPVPTPDQNTLLYDQAIADYTQAIRLNPNYALAYYNRGNVYYRKGDYDRAIADYEAVLRINPNDADARRNLERARQQRGR